MNDAKQPLLRAFLEKPLSGLEMESLSLEIIDQEAPPHLFSEGEWRVVRRMINAGGDFSIMEAVRFSAGAVTAGIRALQACRPIYADAESIRSGISLTRLKGACEFYRRESVICHMGDDDVTRTARRTGLPRSLHALRKARPLLEGALVVIGSSPVALMETSRLIIEEGIRPALVVAMPAGFFHVAEGKEELMGLGVPYIATAGRRGGSPLAISVIHALCELAAGPAVPAPKGPGT